MQQANLLLHQIKLGLLTDDGLIERFDQVFGKGQLGFEFVEACFHYCEDIRNSGVTRFSSRE